MLNKDMLLLMIIENYAAADDDEVAKQIIMPAGSVEERAQRIRNLGAECTIMEVFFIIVIIIIECTIMEVFVIIVIIIIEFTIMEIFIIIFIIIIDCTIMKVVIVNISTTSFSIVKLIVEGIIGVVFIPILGEL